MKNIMKSNYRYIVKAFMAMAVIAGTTSCDDFLVSNEHGFFSITLPI